MAPLLRHVLTLQAKALQRFGNDRIARPVFANLRLQRLDRLQGMTIDDGRADVTDDVVRRRNGGVRQQRQPRSEERRVGNECGSSCRSRWSLSHSKKKYTQ